MTDELTAKTEDFARDLKIAIEHTSMAEVIESIIAPNEVHLMIRVLKESESDWLHGVVRDVLHVVDDTKVELFAGKQFFLKNKKLVFAWVMAWSGPDLTELGTHIISAIEGHHPEIEVGEQPLLGQGAPQSTGPGKKGARPVRAG